MNITGIAFRYPRYVTVEQFISFLPKKYREKKEKEFKKKIEKKLKGTETIASLQSNLYEYWADFLNKIKKNNRHHARSVYTNSFNEKYGKWLSQKNIVIKINDVIFVHGGISKHYSTWKLKKINNLYRKELNFLRSALMSSSSLSDHFRPKIVYDSQGPLWFRELALNDEQYFTEEVDQILSNLSANYMVIAHTIMSGSITVSLEGMSRFGGRIWIIDTGMSDAYGGIPSALIIENGKFSVWGLGDEE
jgi:hypothetical protein